MIPALELSGGSFTAGAFEPRIVRRLGTSGGSLVLSRDGGDSVEVELDPLFFRDLGIRLSGSDEAPVAARFLGGDAVPVAGPSGDAAMLLATDALRAFLDSELPVEMERARRLARAELDDPSLSALSPVQRAEDFESRWIADAFASRVDVALGRAPGTVRNDPQLRATVALWVRRDDVGALQGRGLAATPLVGAVRQPEYRKGAGGDEPTGRTLVGEAGVRHLEAGFGDVDKRRLHFDVDALRVCGIGLPAPVRELLASRIEALASTPPPRPDSPKAERRFEAGRHPLPSLS